MSFAQVRHYPGIFPLRVAISTAPDTPPGGSGRVDVLALLYATSVPLLSATGLNRHTTQLYVEVWFVFIRQPEVREKKMPRGSIYSLQLQMRAYYGRPRRATVALALIVIETFDG